MYLVSDHRVLGNFPAGNDAPEFDPTAVDREINEGDAGMAVGARVTATGGHGALTYALPDTGTDNSKFEIDEKTGQIKNMVDLNYEGVDGGDDQCAAANACVVTVTATDAAGRESDEATVNIKINSVDEKPYFDSNVDTGIQDPAAKVDHDENVEVVDATDAVYTASDPDMGSVNYALMGADGNLFTLNNEKMLRFKTAPDHENPMDRNRDNVYEVTVRASDGTMTEDWMVEVTVTDMNEDPMIVRGGLAVSGPMSKDYTEHGTDVVGDYTATGPMNDMARWTLEGDDAMYFRVGTATGAMTELMFRNAPDYEMPRGMAMSDTNTNTYMVTLKANDGTYMDTHDVRVMVTNMEETGMVTLMPMAPVVGTAVTARLTDPDMVMEDSVMWQWSKSMTMNGTFMDIGVATMMSYTPMAGDGGYYLQATATYTDGYDSGNEEMATTTSAVVSNNEPMFMEGDTATRSVAENTAAGMNFGEPVMATDPDEGDTLTYALGGDDAVSFNIDTVTGQLMTKAALDYETKTEYMVTVTATDEDSASDSIMVTIMVTDVNEAPEFPADTDTRSVAENTAAGMNIGEPVMATDPDEGDTVTYALSGDNAASFDIDTATGQLMTKAALDYETKTEYMVTVTATDEDSASDSIMVTIMVTDMNEAPEFPADTDTRSVAENTAAGMNIGEPVMATDPDEGDTLTYALSGDDAASFDIDAATGQLMTKAALDYDTKTEYMVTVTATDGDSASDSIMVTIMVTDVELAAEYDTNGNQMIDKEEVIAAINDYLFEETLSKAEVIELINLYLFR